MCGGGGVCFAPTAITTHFVGSRFHSPLSHHPVVLWWECLSLAAAGGAPQSVPPPISYPFYPVVTASFLLLLQVWLRDINAKTRLTRSNYFFLFLLVRPGGRRATTAETDMIPVDSSFGRDRSCRVSVFVAFMLIRWALFSCSLHCFVWYILRVAFCVVQSLTFARLFSTAIALGWRWRGKSRSFAVSLKSLHLIQFYELYIDK